MSERRICPECGLPLWEDATAEEREARQFCSPVRCEAWTYIPIERATARKGK